MSVEKGKGPNKNHQLDSPRPDTLDSGRQAGQSGQNEVSGLLEACWRVDAVRV